MKKLLVIISVIFIAKISNAQINLDYFGQISPGDSAVIFAPGIISLSNRLEGRIAFSPDGDEYFITIWEPKHANAKILYSQYKNNNWTTPVPAPFSKEHYTANPYFSSNGNKLYFDYRTSGQRDIWLVHRNGDLWSEPDSLPSPINSNGWDFAYSESNDGTAYFTSNRKGSRLYDIWRTVKDSNGNLKAENLGPIVNSDTYEYCTCISPDGSYLIFVSHITGEPDLYITFSLEHGRWSKPVNLGKKINSDKEDVDPVLSPDGRYLFFSRYSNIGTETCDIYWVDASFIEKLRPDTSTSSVNASGVINDFELKQNYPNPFNPSTTIKYQLKESCNVKLKIYNTLGQKIKTLVNAFQNTGEYSIEWDGNDESNNVISSGVFLFSLNR